MEFLHPAFFAQFWYDQLDYKFPLDDLQKVVRIPVAGPAPFNTLAVVRTIAPGTIDFASGEIRRHTFSLMTPLFLRGYDPLRSEQQQFLHSSSAQLRMLQIKEADAPHIGDWNTDFLLALDAVHPEVLVTPLGQVVLKIDSAEMISSRLASWQFQISSWILCWEPADSNAAPEDFDVLRMLERLNVDFSVDKRDLREWLGNAEFTPYPAISQAILLLQRGLKARAFLDVIVFNYEDSPGVNSPRRLEEVRFDVLKKAILDAFNARHGTALTDPEEVFRGF